jgi:hypothetical protein
MTGRSGSGDGSGYGSGSGSGYGYGEGYGEGYGSGYGSGYGYGYGYGDGDVGKILNDLCGYTVRYSEKWQVLTIGCECHTLDEWIVRAGEIDEAHGDGIADETLALASRLKKEAQGE